MSAGSVEAMDSGVRFDLYLRNVAGSLAARGWRCSAILPDVDGGLLVVVRGEGRRLWHVGVTLPVDRALAPTARALTAGTPEEMLRSLESRLADLLVGHHHPLLEFYAQEVDEVVVGAGRELPQVWQRFLHTSGPVWGEYSLQRVSAVRGALDLVLNAPGGTLRLRVTNADDPRARAAARVLRVNRLVLALHEDTRSETERGSPAGAVDRFVAYVLAHTTGPDTHLGAGRVQGEDVMLHGRDVLTNPFRADARQGASGMVACLFGKPKPELAVLCVGDVACRQTFPPQEALYGYDSWSYFPVRTVPTSGRYHALDFSDRDLIHGCERVLDATLQRPELREASLAVVQTCVSRLAGDDVEGVLKSRLKVGSYVVLDPDFQGRECGVDATVWTWAFERLRPPGKPGEKVRGRVNLVGFGHAGSPAVEELTALLAALDVEVGCCIFPSFDHEDLEQFDRAELSVCLPSAQVRHAFASVVATDTRNRWLEAPAPFGFEGTARFLAVVLEGLEGGHGRAWAAAELVARRAEGGEEARRSAAGLRVALVSGARWSSFVFNPSDLFGIPIVRVLAELGVGVEVLILEDGPVPPELTRLADEVPGMCVRAFVDRSALLEALRTSPAQLLLTSIQRNRPALGLGKTPLFAGVFEMGLDGALRTADRIAALGRLPFVSSYRGFLSP